jgi:hypothetical protein
MSYGHWHHIKTESGSSEFVDDEELDCVSEWIDNYAVELQLHEQRKNKITQKQEGTLHD